ncbi:MFS transporter [Persicirhabdus sediminis]|uniref:MFS transporter n=1 Tax=Persicirhabdus sediminis TaxID=454144 RepID=A0A8J7MB78_9BACT|nr:MFS transporter [Persicirhabdus sediminis]MBK1789786.1 MFS transporter [Persicirhabdus sediminis]
MNEVLDAPTDEPSPRNWKSFWCLFAIQTQNAFNDKAAQFLLIPLGGWLMSTGSTGIVSYMEYVLGALIVLPFILFAPISGWVADRFSKTYVIRAMLLMQVIVLSLITIAIYYNKLYLAIFGFFLLSIESVMLSPAKLGIVKELVGTKRLGFASGISQMATVLAICVGQIAAGFWFDYRLEAVESGWTASLGPLVIVTLMCIPAIIISMGIEKRPAHKVKPLSFGVAVSHFVQLKEIWDDKRLRFSAAGIAFFWGFAGIMNLLSIQIGKDLTGGGSGFGSGTAWMMLAASGGVVIGGVIGSIVCRRRIELGLVPIGGIVMVVGLIALATLNIHAINTSLLFWIAFAGAGSAILLVPLNAYLQDVCPANRRGRILAGIGLLDCLAGIVAVLIQMLLAKNNVPYAIQFSILALVSAAVTLYAARLLPRDFIRFVALGLLRSVYRIKVHHAENIPAKGGVLLCPNHLTYIDAFILSAACPRPVRFLMFSGMFKKKWIGAGAEFFGTVPISSKRPREAMKIAAETLANGDVVCIFPEGQLSRTGTLNELKRGFESIAKMAKVPVLPVFMDGLWGSIFSFERNRYFRKRPYKLPYGVRVSFGDLLEDDDRSVDELRRQLVAMQTGSLLDRKLMRASHRMIKKPFKVLHGDASKLSQLRKQLKSSSADEKSERLYNALQIREINALSYGEVVMVDIDELGGLSPTLLVFLARLLKLSLVIVDANDDAQRIGELADRYEVTAFLAGGQLAQKVKQEELTGKCYDFSASMPACDGYYPCQVIHERVISMSMPHPAMPTSTASFQAGWKSGSLGKLLPGYVWEPLMDRVMLSSPALGELTIDDYVSIDNEGFLLPDRPDMAS